MNNSASGQPSQQKLFYWLTVIWLLGIYIALLYRTGWLSDDARITLEYVDNFVRGNGAVFNLGERVQAYTHALWFLVLSAGTFIWHNTIQVTYIICILLSVASFLLLARLARDRRMWAVLILAGLLFSGGFVDYSTSGLENPLSFLLCGLLLLLLCGEAPAGRTFLCAGLLASCLFLNRPDYALIVFPVLLYLWGQLESWGDRIRLAIIGAMPVILWTLFSLYYYGFPVPNTAYAKLGAEIPRAEMLVQGAHYYLATLRFDVFTLPLLFAALALGVFRGNPRIRLVAAGIVVYLAYLLWIGGDFMLSRHFAVPLYLAVGLAIASLPDRDSRSSKAVLTMPLSATVVISLFSFGFHNTETMRMGHAPYHGIVDERVIWSQYSTFKTAFVKGFRQAPANRPVRKNAGVKTICGWLGVSKAMNRDAHYLDKCGLTDPLIARMPAMTTPEWRIGHFERALPAGYIESLKFSTPVLDKQLSAFTSDLALVTRGDLWSAERLAAVKRLNVSGYDLADLMSDYRISVGELERLKKSAIDTDATDATPARVLPQAGRTYSVGADAGRNAKLIDIKLSSPSGLKVILEYVDNAVYNPDEPHHWRHIDYVVAVFRDTTSSHTALELRQRDNHIQLIYVHVLPLQELDGPVELDLAVQ